MVRILVCLTVIGVLISTGIVAAEETAPQAVIESISYEKDDQDHEKIVFKLNGAHVPKVFAIKGERPRLVFDFIDTRYSDLINRITDTKGDLIKRIRVGIHDDPPKTRVVVDLTPEEKLKYEQDFLAEDNIFSITFYPSDKAQEQLVAADDNATPVVTEKPSVAQSEIKPPDIQPAPEPSEPPADQGTGSERMTVASQADRPVEDTAKTGQDKPQETSLFEQSPPTKPVVDPILRNVSFEKAADGNEMVMFKLNDFYPPIVFGLEKGTPRVVCDFLDTEMDGGVKPVIDANGSFVHRIRVAKHKEPEKVRVVLDLMPNRNYDLQQVFFRDENLFVIVINEFEDEPAATPPTVDLQSVQ